MVKIIFVITQGEMGGAQRYVFDLTTNLDKTKYDAWVLTGTENLELKNRLQEKGIKVEVVKNLVRNIRPLKDLKAVFELKQIFQEQRPEILHLNSSKAGFLGSLAGGFAGVKQIIFTAHGFAFLEPHSWFVRQVYLWAEKLATRFRTKIICVSEYDREAALKYKVAKPQQVVTIHNGIDLQKSTPPQSPPYQGGEREGMIRPPAPDIQHPVIGTIANLYPTKGIKYLIEAARILYSKFHIQNLKFIVIGDGPERQKLNLQLATCNLQQNVFLLGALPNASHYLSQFSIFVLPSIKEGFPYTILEAMAAGLPIVATSVGGIPEIISPSLSPSPQGGGKVGGKACGILVPPKDPQALAKAIIFLLENPEIAETLGRNAREKVKEFSLERMVRKTERVYNLNVIDPFPASQVPAAHWDY